VIHGNQRSHDLEKPMKQPVRAPAQERLTLIDSIQKALATRTNPSKVKAMLNGQISKADLENLIHNREVRHKLNTRGNDSLRINDLKSAPVSGTCYVRYRRNARDLVGGVTLCRRREAMRRLCRRVSRLCGIGLSSSCQHGQGWIRDIVCCRFVFCPRVFRVDTWFPTCPSNPDAFYR
jgi:hypothetical protein